MVFASHFQICHFRLIHTLLSLSILQGSYLYFLSPIFSTYSTPPSTFLYSYQIVCAAKACFILRFVFAPFHSLERADELLAGGVEDPTRGSRVFILFIFVPCVFGSGFITTFSLPCYMLHGI
jgi:hypothetical protein